VKEPRAGNSSGNMNGASEEQLDSLVHSSRQGGDIAQDLNREYDRNVKDIERYFCKRTRDIGDLEKQATTAANREVLEQVRVRKNSVWAKYNKVKKVERQLPLWPSLLLFAFDSGTSIGLGILFNIATTNGLVGIYGFVFFSIQCAGRFAATAGLGMLMKPIGLRNPKEGSARHRHPVRRSV
jgi:hypothetical protein